MFDSATGDPVNGATMTIIEPPPSDRPKVYAETASAPFPATVTTGDRAYGYPPGGFRYPY